jgi:tetratricopeptide (TPR) repeat protein
VHYKLGVIHNIKDNPDKSIPHFRAAINIEPDFARAYYGLGLAYYKKGLMEKARMELETALRQDPGHGEARRLRNEILTKTK